MLTEIPVPYYATYILTLSAALTKPDILSYHLSYSLWFPVEDFSPDIITNSTVVLKFLAGLFCQGGWVLEA